MKSIKQAISEVNSLELEAVALLSSINISPEITSLKFKHMITMCNSLSIVFLHFNLQQNALSILQKALRTDVKMFFQEVSVVRNWSGRVLIYCNLAYLLLKSKDPRSSLKFLYDSENLLIDMENLRKKVYDLRLGHSMLSFLSLFSVKKFDHAEKYLGIAIDSFSMVSERFNPLACKSIYCLLEMMRIIMIGYNEKRSVSVQEAMQELINSNDEFNTATALMERFKGLGIRKGISLLKSEGFYEIVFLTIFFPFVSDKTPAISMEELIWAQTQQKTLSKLEITQIISGIKKCGQDNYSLLMKLSLIDVSFT